jgi:hypothetical protein
LSQAPSALQKLYESLLLEMMVGGKDLFNAFLLHDDYACTISQTPFFVEAAAVELPSLREQRSVHTNDLKIS